jgi:hypothetical protein
MSRLLPTKARFRGEREREKGSGFAHWRCNNNQQQQPVFFSLGTQPFSSSRITMKTVVDKQNKTVLQDFFCFFVFASLLCKSGPGPRLAVNQNNPDNSQGQGSGGADDVCCE